MVWIVLESADIVVTTWNVVDVSAAWESKKPTSCLSTDFRYSNLIRELCLSAVLAQHNPSAKVEVNSIIRFPYLVLVTKVMQPTYERRQPDSNGHVEKLQRILSQVKGLGQVIKTVIFINISTWFTESMEIATPRSLLTRPY